MVIRKISLPLAVLSVCGLGAFGSNADAQVPVARPVQNAGQLGYYNSQYYIASPRSDMQQGPNPTYWTKLPCPLHHNDPCDPCQQQHGMWTPPVVRWVLDPNYYTVAPDYGWSEPGKWPIVRQAPVYNRYYPDVWYGTGKGGQAMPRSYPIVAQPTDTAQMGYYYQTVPQWQPNPSMLPPPPNPRQWLYRPYELGPDGTYKKWVPLQNAWVPIHQLGPQPMQAPIQAPMQEIQAPAPVENPARAPQPAEELAPAPAPAPVPPAPPAAPPAVEASIEPEGNGTIRKASFVQRIFGRK